MKAVLVNWYRFDCRRDFKPTHDWIQSWWGKQGVPSQSHCLENTDEVIRTMLRDWEIEEKQNERL